MIFGLIQGQSLTVSGGTTLRPALKLNNGRKRNVFEQHKLCFELQFQDDLSDIILLGILRKIAFSCSLQLWSVFSLLLFFVSVLSVTFYGCYEKLYRAFNCLIYNRFTKIYYCLITNASSLLTHSSSSFLEWSIRPHKNTHCIMYSLNDHEVLT